MIPEIKKKGGEGGVPCNQIVIFRRPPSKMEPRAELYFGLRNTLLGHERLREKNSSGSYYRAGSGPYSFSPVVPGRNPASTKNQKPRTGIAPTNTNHPLLPRSWHRLTFTARVG